MAYYKNSQAKYKQKLKQYKVQYNLQEQDGERLDAYLKQSGLSANSYLKQIIKADLDNKGFNIDNINFNKDN